MTQSFDPSPQPAQAPAAEGALEMQRAMAAIAELTRRMKSGASNFYWIAALSVVNSILSISGTGTYFVIGLAVTLLVDSFTLVVGEQAPEAALIVKTIGLVVSIIISAVIALFGFFAIKGRESAGLLSPAWCYMAWMDCSCSYFRIGSAFSFMPFSCGDCSAVCVHSASCNS